MRRFRYDEMDRGLCNRIVRDIARYGRDYCSTNRAGGFSGQCNWDAHDRPLGWSANDCRGKGAVPLYDGDVLQTDGSSQALIEFKEGIQVALNESTSFKLLSRWEQDKPTTRILRLMQGEVWAKTSGGPKLFEVETPVATAAVKGNRI